MAGTLAGPVTVRGRALFSGVPCAVLIEPAQRGITFRVGGTEFAAEIGNVSAAAPHPAFAGLPARNTAVGIGAAVVQTTEHLLAALVGLGVTGAVCTVTGPEPPIGDGSAGHFVEAIRRVGIVNAGEPVAPLVITEPVEVRGDEGEAVIVLRPGPPGVTRYRYELDYGPGAAIAAQHAAWDGSVASFVSGVAPARTYSLRHEAEAMRRAGLFAGFTPRDLLVIGDDGAAIDNALRFPDEPARHKLLDLIGDLALAGGGRPIHGEVVAVRSGHRLAQRAARALAAMDRGDEVGP